MTKQVLLECQESADFVALGVPARSTFKEIRVDMSVGAQIRLRRTELQITPEQLSATIGITAAQLVMHESGELRLGAPRLLRLARALDVPVSQFFEGL